MKNKIYNLFLIAGLNLKDKNSITFCIEIHVVPHRERNVLALKKPSRKLCIEESGSVVRIIREHKENVWSKCRVLTAKYGRTHNSR